MAIAWCAKHIRTHFKRVPEPKHKMALKKHAKMCSYFHLPASFGGSVNTAKQVPLTRGIGCISNVIAEEVLFVFFVLLKF